MWLSWGSAFQEEGTTSAKALWLHMPCLSERQQGGQRGWSEVSAGETEEMRPGRSG